ncbi:hypothetical protein [Porticoccus sp.]|nr:MAG: hypothetical protein EP324_06230 [Gammaproteobacteria bacterium]
MKEIEWYHTKDGFTVKGQFFSPISMVAHIERLNGVKVLAKKSWGMTDDFEAFFEYKGYRFIVETPFVEVEVAAFDKRVPKEITKEVLDHAANYKWVNPVTFIWAMLRYFILPFNPR